MNLTPQAMANEVAATGFGAEPLEKVFRLMALLDAVGSPRSSSPSSASASRSCFRSTTKSWNS
jgi:hypothetical protein